MKIRYPLCILLVLALGAACGPKEGSLGSSLGTNANIGGLDGGGGDPSQSTDAQVKKEVEQAYKKLPAIFYNLGLSLGTIEDPYVIRIASKFFDQKIGERGWEEAQPIHQDWKSTTYYFQADGKSGCLEKTGVPHAMGVEHFSPQEPICVSIAQLHVLPPEDLPAQVSALLMHEFAHHFGFGEFDAQKIQYYVLHRFSELSSFPAEVRIPMKGRKLKRTEYHDEGTFISYYFQHGKQLDEKQLSKADPYCALNVSLDDLTFDWLLKHKRTIELKTYDQEINLGLMVEGVHCDFKSPCQVNKVQLSVNRVWAGNSWESNGAGVDFDLLKDAQNKIVSGWCAGENLRYTDILVAFNGDLK